MAEGRDATSYGIEELLRFYAETGVDAALEEEPANRFAEPVHEASQQPAATGEPTAPAALAHEPSPPAERTVAAPAVRASVPDEAQAARARQLAGEAATLDELRDILAGFDGCNLKFTAKNLVFADGDPRCGLMLVGEAPGRDEDMEGVPFVGRSGRLLDRMLAAIDIERSSAYIANVIPWRPPGNRTPTPLETEICRPFIERQIELANPKVLVALGAPSAKVLTSTTEGIMRLRGNWKVHATRSGADIPTMPTLHPAYLLRNPAHKRLAWRDFLEIKAKFRSSQGG